MAHESNRHFHLTMDSLRCDLHGALEDKAGHETTPKASPAERRSHQGLDKCRKCHASPAPERKLRYCGRCEMAKYCSKACARADWPEHKLACECLRRCHNESLAQYTAQGGRKKDVHQHVRNLGGWFDGVPGLFNEIDLFAWKHRRDAPFFHVSTSWSDDDGSLWNTNSHDTTLAACGRRTQHSLTPSLVPTVNSYGQSLTRHRLAQTGVTCVCLANQQTT